MSGSQTPPGNPASGGTAAGGAASTADPSMEDILASIRRILSEDEPAPAAAPPPLPEPVQEEEDDVLVLDATMEVAEPHEPEPEPLPPAPEAERVFEPAPAPPPAPVVAMESMPVAALMAGSELMAPETADLAASAVSGLMRTLANERSTRVYGGGPTIEDLVREELRPLLKTWLDTNLPDLVERLVRNEIERVVRRAVP